MGASKGLTTEKEAELRTGCPEAVCLGDDEDSGIGIAIGTMEEEEGGDEERYREPMWGGCAVEKSMSS